MLVINNIELQDGVSTVPVKFTKFQALDCALQKGNFQAEKQLVKAYQSNNFLWSPWKGLRCLLNHVIALI